MTEKNSGKVYLLGGKRTPFDILIKDKRSIDPQVLGLPAIDLDKHQDIYWYKKDPTYRGPFPS